MLARESSTQVLLVEGNDERHVISHMRHRLANQGFPVPEFKIEAKNGIEPLLDSIEWQVKVPDLKSLGILVDANDDPGGRWQAVTVRLRRAGAEPPSGPVPSGVIIEGTLHIPRIGVWMMPDNVSSGELEDFIAAMIPDGDPIWPRSQSYVEDIPETHRKFKPPKTLRAQVHAWLAAREDPRQIGQAITAGDLDVNAEVCRRFADWLRTLFGE